MEDFKNSGINILLNLSLHASDDEQRKRIIPFSALYEVEQFYEKIIKKVCCGIFRNFGADIKGGCGQLRCSKSI